MAEKIQFTKGRKQTTHFSLLVFHRDGSSIIPLFQGKTLTVGREQSADVSIPNSTLSPQHSLFEMIDDDLWVRDLNSLRGTWVNGKAIKTCKLEIGWDVYVGDVTIYIHKLTPGESPLHRFASHEQFITILNEEVGLARAFGSTFGVLSIQSLSSEKKNIGKWCQGLRKFLRPTDRIAVFSPNALEIVALKCTSEMALKLGRRLVTEGKGSALICGISLFPDSATTPGGLLDASRTALHRADSENPVQLAPNISVHSFPNSDSIEQSDVVKPVMESTVMKSVFATVERVARSNIPVLIMGETGSGKEIVTRMIHERSSRQKKPFCAVNCGAIPEPLIESILFGHEKGSFTGAETAKTGMFEQAEGGTLLLDEVAELPLQAQATLLRVLEDRRVRKVGSSVEKSVNVRILAATHQELEMMCRAGTFRWDLLYRLNTMTLRIPPLRERYEDIEPLVEYFIKYANRVNECKVHSITNEAIELIYAYSWPGNVRELRNAIERAVVVSRDGVITVNDLPGAVRNPTKRSKEISSGESLDDRPRGPLVPIVDEESDEDFKTRVRRFEESLISEALRKSGGNQSAASRLLKIPLRTLVRKIQRYGLKH